MLHDLSVRRIQICEAEVNKHPANSCRDFFAETKQDRRWPIIIEFQPRRFMYKRFMIIDGRLGSWKTY